MVKLFLYEQGLGHLLPYFFCLVQKWRNNFGFHLGQIYDTARLRLCMHQKWRFRCFKIPSKIIFLPLPLLSLCLCRTANCWVGSSYKEAGLKAVIPPMDVYTVPSEAARKWIPVPSSKNWLLICMYVRELSKVNAILMKLQDLKTCRCCRSWRN